jgi:sensor histidine kinase YesM
MEVIEVDKLTKEIYDKYPEVWEKIKSKGLINNYFDLFCNMTSLWEEHNIDVGIISELNKDTGKRIWYFEIDTNNLYDVSDDGYKSKKICQQQAILKSCEILEKQLKENK